MADKKTRKFVKSADDASTTPKPTVIGTFTGECVDPDETNKNGMDIGRDVFRNVFASDEYKTAIELGHYIGFLGHPEDPNCMDFEHACIVMKDGYLDESDGKVYGTFDLIDTPVGRIVKAFIDAGVKFGISIRGAGDIDGGVVDPDTFIFRGFDLVTFPAYPNSIPEFTEIAASSDLETQKKYKKICAAVKNNIDGLNTVEAIEAAQRSFPAQSETYKMLEEKKKSITATSEVDATTAIYAAKIDGLTNLYIEASQALEHEKQIERSLRRKYRKVQAATNEEIERLNAENKQLRSQMISAASQHRRKIDSIKRITAAQMKELDSALAESARSKSQVVKASQSLKAELRELQESNLKYKQKVNASTDALSQKSSAVDDLRGRLNETVAELDKVSMKVSNLDAANKRLRAEITAAHKLIEEYQNAYGNMYANAIGVHLDAISVTASTSVSEMQKLITSSSRAPQQQLISDPTPEIDLQLDGEDDGLVTA